jgi:peptidoglycan biosynthesis protein MviN/MurJ (putative lipid II flippase)
MLSTGLVILMILLNLWLIPALGVNGAALANGLSFFLFNFSKWAIIRNKFGWNPFGIWFLHSAMLCAGLTASLWLLPMGEIPAWLAIIIKGLIIIFSYYIFIDKTPYFSEVRGMKEKWMNKWIRKAS